MTIAKVMLTMLIELTTRSVLINVRKILSTAFVIAKYNPGILQSNDNVNNLMITMPFVQIKEDRHL